MSEAPAAANEEARLDALYEYDILDTVAEQSFDAICQLASTVCEAPISLVSLLDRQRQWFKAVVGLDVRETERECSICAHAILEDDMLVIDDLKNDERTCDNRLVVRAPKMRFYAGEPLHAYNGHRIGTLCVIDQRPRVLEEDQKNALRILARQTEAQLEVRRLNAELIRVDTVREQLTQYVAHDLNSPLTAIILAAHQLGAGASPERARELVGDLLPAAETMRTLIADLRDTSLGRSGVLAPRYEDVEPAALIDSAVRAMGKLAHPRVQIRIDETSEPSRIQADPNLLQRLVQNLLSNGCQYAESTVSVGCEDLGDGRMAIAVEDDGPGIPAAERKRIFELYARASQQQYEASRGLGLAFCQAVAQAHGGTIEVLAREPRGSRFRTVLPIQSPTP